MTYICGPKLSVKDTVVQNLETADLMVKMKKSSVIQLYYTFFLKVLKMQNFRKTVKIKDVPRTGFK